MIGRFYSNDPIGFRDVHSFNRYAYANNNPYKYVDPTGMCSRDAKGNPEGGICPAEGDKEAERVINERLKDKNSITSEVENRMVNTGLLTIVDTRVVSSTTDSQAFEPDPEIGEDGEILLGLIVGNVTGTVGNSSNEVSIPLTVAEVFEHEVFHILDQMNGNTASGAGLINVSGKPVNVIYSNGFNRGAIEGRAVNHTNGYRRRSKSGTQRTRY